MLSDIDDTICALATPSGAGGLGVLRVSGPEAFAVVDGVTRRRAGRSCGSYRGHTLHRAVVVDTSGEGIDDVLLAVFHAPRSYTGEDVVEISAHGGPVPLRRILGRLLECGARLAQSGEFTQRAFLHGKMDLAQAEAVGDMIAARTDEAHALAVRQGEGHLSGAVRAVREGLLGALARIEASVDFPEEVGPLDAPGLARDIDAADAAVLGLLRTAGRGILVREGLTLVIAGRPNVGKSSLLNCLLRVSRALVSPVPGTTRDTVEEAFSLRGIPLRAIDTAGVRDTSDVVEGMGVARTRDALARADFVLLVRDASAGQTLEDVALQASLAGRGHLVVWNKWDLVGGGESQAGMGSVSVGGVAGVPLCAATGWNVAALEDAIADAVLGAGRALDAGDAGGGAVVSHARHRRALESACESLRAARRTLEGDLPPDFVAIDVRGALDALGEVTGETAGSDIIGEIFGRFCIGK